MKKIEEIVEEVLRTEPSFHLRMDFKDQVINKFRKKERASQKKLYIWMALGVIIMLGFGYGILAYFLPATIEGIKGVKSFSNQLVPMAVLLGVLITLVQILDKKLVKKKTLHY